MLDKLKLSAPKSDLTKERTCKLLQGQYSKCNMTASKFHQEVLEFYVQERKLLLSVHLHPRLSHISEIKIELNPSHFINFDGLNKLVTSLADPSELQVNRIDHAVDLPGIDVQTLYSSLIASRKKCREVYKDGVTLETFYLGRQPELLVVYDKAKQMGLQDEIKTRVELQQYREKVPFRGFLDLANFQSYKPFEKLKFKTVDPNLAVSVRDRQKQAALEQWISKNGAQATYKLLNRHSNFKRDFAGLLADNTRIPDLNKLYQQNMEHFFSEGGK